MARALINVPSKAKVGDIIEIKTLVSHPMETGYRVGMGGEMIPRDIIQTFVCAYNGVEIYRAEFSQAIAANPYLSFHTMATETGVLEFRWTGDNDFLLVETALAGWTEHWQVAFGPFVLLVALFAPRGIWGLVRGREKP